MEHLVIDRKPGSPVQVHSELLVQKMEEKSCQGSELRSTRKRTHRIGQEPKRSYVLMVSATRH